MRRRSFLTLLGGAAAAWPLAATAQQRAPVVGILFLGWPEGAVRILPALRQGLSEGGYVEGRNVAIEYRWAEGHSDRLPALATELVQRGVAVIVTPDGTPAARAAKAATTTIPIVFGAAGDPVQSGLVASLNRPGANVTGINDMGSELDGKRLGILSELMPAGARFAVLANPDSVFSETYLAMVNAAAATSGRQIEIFKANSDRGIEVAFASLVQKHFDALALMTNLLFSERRVQIITLATRHLLPTIAFNRQWSEAGVLMSYGPVPSERFRLIGVYTARVLKGEKPADLPVMRPTRFELVINNATARALGVTVPPTLLSIADEVIE